MKIDFETAANMEINEIRRLAVEHSLSHLYRACQIEQSGELTKEKIMQGLAIILSFELQESNKRLLDAIQNAPTPIFNTPSEHKE